MARQQRPAARGRCSVIRWLAALLLASTGACAGAADPLADGFATPPQSARPRVWWHWMNGNITKDGIAKDLAWMSRIGIGGAQTFDAAMATPQIVDRRLAYMSPEWKDAFRTAAADADHLGLELGIASSPGWSETGGPWVAPKDGLKKLVWSETEIVGGRHFVGRLASPPVTTGPFLTAPFDDPLAAFGGKPIVPPTYYADAVVLAYPLADPAPLPPARMTADGKLLDGTLVDGHDLAGGIAIEQGTAAKPGMVAIDYAAPQTIRSATIAIPGAKSMFVDATILPVLEAEDATGWRRIATLPLAEAPTTVAFAPVTARRFRLLLEPSPPAGAPGLGDGAPGAIVGGIFPTGPATTTVKLAELRLESAPRVDRFEQKAGFAIARDYYALATTAGDDAGVAPGRVIDISRHMRPDGTLDWTPPPGRWRILRLGASLLGTTNHPATPEATGLEVDKFDRAAVHEYLETYLGTYRDAAGPGLIGTHGVRAMVTDSIEVGAANWTPKMIAQFQRLRGYDPTPWLPALTGTIIGSRAQSDAFLYDYRRTLAELIASEHYGEIAKTAHAHGLTLYGEALESLRPSLGDDMAMRSHTDVPMAAMWAYNRGGTPRPTLLADIKGAASVAHIYGQNIVAAESFTSAFSPWAYAPSDLKRIADLEFALGVNRPVVHTSVHQPTDDKLPGLSLAIFGQYFNRHETWAEMAGPWVEYLARSGYLLQQGRYYADVAYFYGEEAPLTSLYGDRPIGDAPTHYGYDFVNPDVLSNKLTVENGDLVAPTGARYRILYLGGSSRRMTLPTLRRIAALAQAGAVIVGEPPESSPSLADDPAAFARLTRMLWSGKPVTPIGKGRVIAGHDVERALASLGIAPDFVYASPEADDDILTLHRRLADGDLYFVDNRANRQTRVEARFRVSGRQPELWHADSGTAEPISYRFENGQTIVPLDLAAEESVFVVFRKTTRVQSATVAKPTWRELPPIATPWTVRFQPDRGAPASVSQPSLRPLNESGTPGIRYFSGIATYSNSFTLAKAPGRSLLLDLGKVGDIAEVRVNGIRVGTAWHAPYRVDIAAAAHVGQNRLVISVANLWVNRLIGDAQPDAHKISWTPLPTYRADAPLRASGLIGPIALLEPVE